MIAERPELAAEMSAFVVPVRISIRTCRAADLLSLEWFGTYTHHRELIQTAFARQERGEVLMLLAAASGDAPVGQVWIDFTCSGTPEVGWIWALRVFPMLRGRGIGSRLLDAAEQLLARSGFARVEISVETSNAAAQRLYESRGYRFVRRIVTQHAFTTPWGELERHQGEEWLMRKQLTPPASGSSKTSHQKLPGAQLRASTHL